MTNPFVPVSKAGEWKTIQQRELKAAGARKKQRRALATAGTAAGAAGALAVRNPSAARAAVGQVRNVRNLPRGTRAAGVGRMARANPTGTAITGLAGASGASLGVAGSQRGVEAYHQHKINQRRRTNRKGVSKAFEPVVPASRRRPQVAARNAVRRPNREKNPFLVQKAERPNRREKAGVLAGTGMIGTGNMAVFGGARSLARGEKTRQQFLDAAEASLDREPTSARRRGWARGTPPTNRLSSKKNTGRAPKGRFSRVHDITSPDWNQSLTRANRQMRRGKTAMAAGMGGAVAGTALAHGSYTASRNRIARERKSKVSKKEWSDRRLAGHKRAQSYLSSGGATLGIGALGAAGVAAATKNPRAAARLTRLTKKPADQIRQKANRASPALTTGSAGVGGIGGFNFAAIQSQEAKRGQKVKKSMSTSVWGIDHGVVSKNDNRHRTAGALGAAGGALSYTSPLATAAAGGYGASQARKGRRAAVGGRVGGRTAVEGFGGGLAGMAAGRALSGSRIGGRASGMALGGTLAGAALGTAAGSAHGASAAMRNARRRGDLKPVRKADEKDEKKVRVSDAFARPAANDKKKDDKKKTVDTSGAKVVQ